MTNLLTGLNTKCYAEGELFEYAAPGSDMGQIYVYRQDVFFQKGAQPTVIVGEQEFGRLYNAGFLRLQLPPGEHELVVHRGKGFKSWLVPTLTIDLEVKPGKTHFVRVTPISDGISAIGNMVNISGTGTIELVSEALALTELEELRDSLPKQSQDSENEEEIESPEE